MLEKIIKALFGSQHERDLKKMLPILHSVNEKEAWAAGLAAEEFPKQTALFRERHKNGESLDRILPEAFALAREAARRNLGERPYDVQILGGIVLHKGKIVEQGVPLEICERHNAIKTVPDLEAVFIKITGVDLECEA